MAIKIESILESIRTHAGNEVYEKVGETCGTSDLKAIISGLEEISGESTVAAVLRQCGSRCIPQSYLARAGAIYEQSRDLDDFLRELNKTRIGGGKLHVRDGKIIGIYEKCYCPLAKKSKGLSPLFCHCSEGWYEKLFSYVLAKPVTVNIISSVLSGAEQCEFEISY